MVSGRGHGVLGAWSRDGVAPIAEPSRPGGVVGGAGLREKRVDDDDAGVSETKQ